MILQRLWLESFRCFGPQVTIGPFSERVTVLHGPNATGKTTVLMALERVLFDRPTSQDQEILALRPWTASVAPRVKLEIQVEGETLRMEKEFKQNGRTELHILRDGRYERWKEDDDAVAWLRERMGGEAARKGATRPEHRGLAQVLFVPQGGVVLPRKLGGAAVDRLQQVVGTEAMDPATGAIEEAIAREHGELFGKRGPRPSSPASRLEKDLEEARREKEKAREHWESIDDLRHELESAREAAGGLESTRKELARQEQELKPRCEKYRELRRGQEKAEREEREARERYQEMAGRIDDISRLRRQLEERSRELSELENTEGKAQAQLDLARQELATATRLRQEHAQAAPEVQAALREATEARSYRAAQGITGELEPRLQRWRDLQEELSALEETLAQLPAPRGREIQKLREARAEERSTREALEGMKLRLRLEAHRDLRVSGEEGEVSVPAGGSREWSGEGTLALDLTGVARLEISGPASDLGSAREKVLQATARVKKLAADLGSEDPVELEVQRDQRKETAAQRDELQARRDEQLAPGQGPEEVADRIAQARGEISQLEERHPDWAERPPDPESLEEVARRQDREHTAELERRGRREKAAQEDVNAAEKALEDARRATAASRTLKDRAEGELTSRTSDGLDDEGREKARRQLSIALQSAEDASTRATRSLDAFPADPEQELQRVQAQHRALADQALQLNQTLGRKEAALEEALKAAPYSRLATAEEKFEELERALQRALLDAEATRLLHELFTEERARVTERLLGPVTNRVLPRLQALAGPRIEEVQVNEQFRPVGVRLRGIAEPVDPEHLSFGTQDQLGLLVRLALGELVAREERLPAVLDDPLAHADPSRLRRFLGVLEEVADSLQLVILTCRPSDYGGLESATFLDLSELCRSPPPAEGP